MPTSQGTYHGRHLSSTTDSLQLVANQTNINSSLLLNSNNQAYSLPDGTYHYSGTGQNEVRTLPILCTSLMSDEDSSYSRNVIIDLNTTSDLLTTTQARTAGALRFSSTTTEGYIHLIAPYGWQIDAIFLNTLDRTTGLPIGTNIEVFSRSFIDFELPLVLHIPRTSGGTGTNAIKQLSPSFNSALGSNMLVVHLGMNNINMAFLGGSAYISRI